MEVSPQDHPMNTGKKFDWFKYRGSFQSCLIPTSCQPTTPHILLVKPSGTPIQL